MNTLKGMKAKTYANRHGESLTITLPVNVDDKRVMRHMNRQKPTHQRKH